MGVRGKLNSAVRKITEKVKEKDLVERVREVFPKVVGIGTAVGSYYLIKDASVDFIEIGKIGEFPVYAKLIIAGAAGYFIGTATDRITYNFLFRPESRNIDDLIEEKTEKKNIWQRTKESIAELKNPVVLALEHPKISSFLLMLKPLQSWVVDSSYKFIYKPLMLKSYIEAHKAEAIAKWGVDGYEIWMHQCNMVLKAASLQLVPMAILMYMGMFGATAVLITMVNTLFNPKYRKNSIKRLNASYFAKKEEYDKSISLLNEAIEIMPTSETYFQLGEYYLKDQRIYDALKAYSYGLKIKSKKSPMDKFLEDISIIVSPMTREYRKRRKKIRKNPEEVSNYFNLAALHWRLPNRHLSYNVMDEAERKFPDNIHIRFIYAMMLDESTDKSDYALSQEKWAGGIEILLKNPSNRFRKAHESSNEVLECILDEFIRGAIIFKKGDGKNLEKEMELVNESQRLAEGFSDYKTVRSLRIFDFAGEKVYGMKRDEGEKLYFLKNKDMDIFLKVADFLALVHARFPGAMSEKGRIDLPSAVRDKLAYRDLNLPGYLIKKVIDNYAPVYNSFANATYVFNKDANPENWIVGRDGKITAIDWEDKGLVPMQFDLVNLLEYNGTALKDEQKDALIREYASSYNKYKGEKTASDMDGFMLGYFNAVVQRAIALCSAWSSLDRPIMREKRSIVLDNAINSLGRLEREHKEYYTQHRANYESLKEALEEIKAICSSA